MPWFERLVCLGWCAFVCRADSRLPKRSHDSGYRVAWSLRSGTPDGDTMQRRGRSWMGPLLPYATI
jgi:hypothetical protein